MPIYFFFITILAQVISFGLSLVVSSLYPGLWVLILYAILAWLIARTMRLPTAWQIVNALLGPAVLGYGLLGLPPSYALFIAIILLLIYVPTFWTRVPFYPTSELAYRTVLDELPSGRSIHFIDLGSGFGSLLLYLARARPESEFVGIELSPLAYLISKIRTRLNGLKNLHWIYGNFWELPLKDFDVVYAFLAPPPMPRLWEKVKQELKPGSILLVNSFPVPSQEKKVIEINSRRPQQLYLYSLS